MRLTLVRQRRRERARSDRITPDLAVLETLFDAPGLTADDARTLFKLLKRRFPELDIPAPFEIAEAIERVDPIPQLSLRTVTLEDR